MAKRHSYARKIFSHTWKETEWASVIVEDMLGGVITAAGALALHICQWDEFQELAFLAIGGALVSFGLSFIFRLIFITPAKLHKEMEKRIKSLESKSGEIVAIEAPEKYRTPLAMTFLLCLSACLAVLLIAQDYKFKNRPTVSPKASTPKPLPTQFIPPPEPLPRPPIEATQQPVIVATQEQFETFESPARAPGSALASAISKAQSESKALKEQQDEKNRANAESENKALNDWWTNALPYYNYAVVSLRDVLTKEAGSQTDGVSQPYGYFQCLPSGLTTELDSKITGKKLTEIRFEKATNIDFFISVDGNSDQQRPLRIFCSSGFLQIHPFNGYIWGNINIPSLGIDLQTNAPFDQSHAMIDEALNALVGAQESASGMH